MSPRIWRKRNAVRCSRDNQGSRWSDQGLHGANQILQADYAGGIGTLLAALTGVLDEPKLAGLVKVAGLLTDLSSAKTGDEVATALEKSAAPLGGWRQRRQYSMFSLSAQLGLHAKLEHVLCQSTSTARSAFRS